MIKDYFNLAFISIRKRGLRSWLTMIGIFIGIAAIVSLIGLGEGLKAAINSQLGFLGKDVLAIMPSGGFGPPGTGVTNPLTDKELDAVKRTAGVKGAVGRIQELVKLNYNKKTMFNYAISIPDGDGRDVLEKILKLETQKGRLLEDGDKGYVVLGANFMKDDNLFGKAITAGSKIKIQDKEFKVMGILEKKGSIALDRAVFMNEEDLRNLVDRPGDDYDLIGALVDENAEISKIKFDIEKELRKIRKVKEGYEDFSVQTPQSIIANVNNILLGVQIFIYIIAGISILVGGIGIMNTMYASVVERTKDIGIMKSIGAKNSAIFWLFFIESGLLGAVGGFVGSFFGYLMANGLAFAGRFALGSSLISANVTLPLILSAILFSFVVGSFFGTLPAVQASRLNPVDSLRRAR